MNSMLLTPDGWDLTISAVGDIAIATDPYSQAQDAACEIRTFQGECYYDTTRGVPYFSQILGRPPSYSLMRAEFNAAALRTPGLVASKCFFTSFIERVLRGQVQVTNESGEIAAAGF